MYDAGNSGERIIIHEKSLRKSCKIHASIPQLMYIGKIHGGGGGGGGVLVSNFPWKKSVWKYFPREDRFITVHVCLQVR